MRAQTDRTTQSVDDQGPVILLLSLLEQAVKQSHFLHLCILFHYSMREEACHASSRLFSFYAQRSDAADLMKGMLGGDRAVIRCRHHLTQRLGDHITCAIDALARRLAVGIHDHIAFFIEHIEPL